MFSASARHLTGEDFERMESMNSLILNMKNVALHVQSEDSIEAIVEVQRMADAIDGQQRTQVVNVVHVAVHLQREEQLQIRSIHAESNDMLRLRFDNRRVEE